jgi:uncharacterized RDD family membrane protein YckC
LIILIGVVIGILLVVIFRDYVKELGELIEKAKKGSDLGKWFDVTLLFGILLFFVIAYLTSWWAVSRGAQWIYRKICLRRILKEIISSGDRTANNVLYASLLRRVGAYCIDVCLQFMVAWIVFFAAIVAAFSGSLYLALGCLISFVVFTWWYSVLQIAWKRQATMGMRLFGIYRTDLSGGRLSIGRATSWWLYRLFLSTPPCGLGFIIQPFMKKGQTFHDWLAGSVVLRRQ